MSTRLWTDSARGYLSTYWWLTILRGIVAILFGIAVLARPGLTVGLLLLLFGAFALASGVLAMISSVSLAVHHKRWWAMMVEGIIGVIVGLITFYMPVVTALFAVILIAIWAILIGVFQFIAAITRFGPAAHGWLVAIAGLLSVVLGVLLFAYPGVGLLLIIWFLGIYALVFGVDQIVLGFQLRHLDEWIQTTMHPTGA